MGIQLGQLRKCAFSVAPHLELRKQVLRLPTHKGSLGLKEAHEGAFLEPRRTGLYPGSELFETELEIGGVVRG